MTTEIPQDLYLQPEEYLDYVDNPETLDNLAKLYFNAPKSTPQHLPIIELLSNFLNFSTSRLASDFAACALFTALVDLHSSNIMSPSTDLNNVAKSLLLKFSLEIPTFYTAVLEFPQAKICADFLDEFYCQVGGFWRFLFAPQPILAVKSCWVNEITTIQNNRQIGVLGVESQIVKGSSRPGSKSGNKQPAVESSAVSAQKAKYEYQVTLQPLQGAEMWIKPADPTQDEICEEKVKEVIQEVKDEEGEKGDGERAIDVEKMAQAIQIAAQNELEKVKARVIQELENGKTGKKK